MTTLELRDEYEKQTVLLALEVLGKLGVGKFSDVAARIACLHRQHGKKCLSVIEGSFNRLEGMAYHWKANDEFTSVYTLTAMMLKARIDQSTGYKKLEERVGQKKAKLKLS